MISHLKQFNLSDSSTNSLNPSPLCSEKIDFGAILLRILFARGEIVWRGQGHNLHVVVREKLSRLFVGPLVAIRAQTSLINDMVGDVLCVLDGSTRVVHSLVAFTH